MLTANLSLFSLYTPKNLKKIYISVVFNLITMPSMHAKNTVLIFGLPQVKSNEDVYKVVQSLFQEKLNLNDIDIEVAHHISPYKTDDNAVNSKTPVSL